MAVEEENQLDKTSISQQKDLSDHERQLLLEYKTKEALEDSENSSRKNQGKKQGWDKRIARLTHTFKES